MGQDLPLLLSAALGKKVNRPPVWMMRQAGRYMKIYRDLRERYPSFRERSENPELSYEISMQPFHAFKPDGVILFSDILTPLPGMGINFDIIESKGPIIEDPIRTLNQIEYLKELNPSESLSFVGQVLSSLIKDVNNEATVLGFVGAPWTLAAYVVEGKSSKNYSLINSMAFKDGVKKCNPVLLEPMMKVEVESPDDFLGSVIGDLSSRRGQVEGQSVDDGLSKVQAKVPLAEMFGYATQLRSMTQGRGIFSMEFANYEEVPRNVAEAIISKNQGNS